MQEYREYGNPAAYLHLCTDLRGAESPPQEEAVLNKENKHVQQLHSV
jgi:hypothetical protein